MIWDLILLLDLNFPIKMLKFINYSSKIPVILLILEYLIWSYFHLCLVLLLCLWKWKRGKNRKRKMCFWFMQDDRIRLEKQWKHWENVLSNHWSISSYKNWNMLLKSLYLITCQQFFFGKIVAAVICNKQDPDSL